MGMPEYTDFLDPAERYDEVRLDTTMVFTDFSERFNPFPATELARLADLGDRIRLGSDFPNIPYTYVHQLEVLSGSDWVVSGCAGFVTRTGRGSSDCRHCRDDDLNCRAYRESPADFVRAGDDQRGLHNRSSTGRSRCCLQLFHGSGPRAEEG